MEADASLSYGELVPGVSLEVSVCVDPVHPWHEVGRLAVARSNLIFFLYRAMRALDITCLAAATPVIKLPPGSTTSGATTASTGTATTADMSTAEIAALLKEIRGGSHALAATSAV